jgi:hypothetical protein
MIGWRVLVAAEVDHDNVFPNEKLIFSQIDKSQARS